MKAGEHGPDRLYDKFVVAKTKHCIFDADLDALLVPVERRLDKEFVFVLRPETDDDAAKAALRAYADVCEATYPDLARDIRRELERIG